MRCAADEGMAVKGRGALSCPHRPAPSSPQAACAASQEGEQGCRRLAASPLLSALPLQVEGFRATTAQRLVRMLQMCAGHVPGVSALNLLSLMRSSENPFLEDV